MTCITKDNLVADSLKDTLVPKIWQASDFYAKVILHVGSLGVNIDVQGRSRNNYLYKDEFVLFIVKISHSPDDVPMTLI